MTSDWTLDLSIAPAGAAARLAKAINQRPKRAFGVLKTQNEYIGVVDGDRFEIWERGQRAVHVVGRIGGVRGGTRIEMRFVLPPRTRVLLIVFIALYLAVSLGIALRDGTITIDEPIIAIAGAGVLAVIWTVAAMRQRADLRAFVARVLSEAPPSQSRR